MRPKRASRIKSHLSRLLRRISTPDPEEGVYLDQVPSGTRLVVQTAHHQYLIEARKGCEALLSGHPVYCPEPVGVTLYGSRSNAATLVPGFIGLGHCLVLLHPTGRFIRTSRVRAVRKLDSAQMIWSKICTEQSQRFRERESA